MKRPRCLRMRRAAASPARTCPESRWPVRRSCCTTSGQYWCGCCSVLVATEADPAHPRVLIVLAHVLRSPVIEEAAL